MPEGTPRWVKVAGVVALVIVLAFVVLLIGGFGEHGPGRHGLSGDDTPSSGAVPDAAPPASTAVR